MIAAWLFLYLGGLIHVLAVYGLEFQSTRSAILLLPILLIPLPVLLKRRHPALVTAVPQRWLEGAAAVLGKRAAVQRLCSSLQVDMEKTRLLLGWQPPLSLDQGLQQAVRALPAAAVEQSAIV